MARLTPEIMKQIEAAAKTACLQSGIPETVDGPLGKSKNPAFEACLNSKIKDAVREAKRGRLKEWFGGVNEYVQQQGGILGLLNKLGSISESIRGGQTIMPGTEQDVPVDESGKIDDDKNKSKVGVWIAVILLIILIVFLVIVLMRKSKSGNE